MEADFFEYELDALCRRYGRRIHRKHRTTYSTITEFDNRLLDDIHKGDPTYIGMIKDDCWYRLARGIGKELANTTRETKGVYKTQFSATLTILTDQKINEYSNEIIVC